MWNETVVWFERPIRVGGDNKEKAEAGSGAMAHVLLVL